MVPSRASDSKLRAAPVQPAGSRFGSGPWRFETTGSRRRPRVLLVDDDDDVRELYAWCMRAGGWVVESAADGEQALLKAVGCDPYIIVLDLGMPRMDGAEVLRLLRRSASLSFVPVVLCTVRRGPETERLAREAGCVAYVAKPCAPESLRALVESVLTNRTAAG